MPRASVGMLVYNAERFLDEAIMSIREQDFGDLELIICDNASTDGTEAIARRHAAADPRVSYHRAEINAGAASQLQLVV
ncbi:MAG: glycosyltransferase [Ilumatobacteraceae bacterium]